MKWVAENEHRRCGPTGTSPILEHLEDRVLLSGGLPYSAGTLDVGLDYQINDYNAAAAAMLTLANAEMATAIGELSVLADSAPQQTRNGVVFVDPTVEGQDVLLEGISDTAEVVVLSVNRDGIAQITEYLEGRSGIETIHIISHGGDGELQLGNSQLNGDTLGTYRESLAVIGSVLTAEADILLYGCDVAQSRTGLDFIQQLADITGADVAASDDDTGAAALGGDWDLEQQTGDIESDMLAVNDYEYVLPVTATLTYISPNAYDVSTSVYAGAGEELDVSGQETAPQGLAFNNDGTKMFVVGNDDDAVVEYSLSTAYDVSTATYAGAGEEFSVGGQDTAPRGLAFNNDGTKMFVIGSIDDAVVEYTLSTAYDVSTATYAGAGEEFSVNGQESGPTGLAFNDDGTKMFVIGNADDAVVEYSLSVAYDVSTAIYAGAGEEFDVSGQEGAPRGLAFNNDGTKMFVIGNADNAVVEYSLSVAYDVSTATYAGAGEELSVSGQENNSQGLAFNNDGTKMFVTGGGSGAVVEYTIDPGNYSEAAANDGSIDNSNPLVIVLTADTFQDSDADNILDVGSEVTVNNVPTGLTAVMTLSQSDTVATLTFTGNATYQQDLNNVADITFVFDDTAFTGGDASVVSNSGDGGAYSSNVGIDFEDNPSLTYIPPNAYDVSGAVYAGTGEELDVSGQEATPTGFAFNNDGTKMFVLGETDDAVVEYALSTAYDVSTASYAGAGEEFYIGGQETFPTGLAFNNDGTKMFVIGITGDAVVEYSLSTAYDVSTATYAGAGEEFSVNAEEADPTDLAFNDDGRKMFVIGNVGNAVVEYNLSVAYDVSTATYAGAGEEFDVGGQETTPRGLVFDNDGTKMFVIGSDDSAVVEYSLSAAYDVSTATYAGAGEEFSVGGQESYPRSLAFNNDGTKMFVIGHAGDAVVEYSIDPGNYAEAAANDGSLDNSNPIVIVLAGDTFQDTDADNLLDVGSEVTINNVPAGLTAVMTLSASDTVATLTLTGNATYQQDLNNVADITFVFDDTAFTGGDAAVVLNSGDGGAYSSNVGIDFEDNPTLTYISPNAYDVSTSVYAGAGEEFSVKTEDGGPQAIIFNSDGTKMFVLGISGDAVVEYSLSTAYDVSTAVYAGAGEEFYVGGQEGAPRGLAFNNDGTKMFIAGADDDAVVEYSLSTAYDVSTAVYAGAGEEFYVGGQEGTPRGLVFNNDGSKMLVIGDVDDAVVEYSLSTAYDVSTAVYAGAGEEFYAGAQEGITTGLTFNNDGTKMFVIGNSTDSVYEYNLSTAYDVSTAVYAGDGEKFYIGGSESTPQGVTFNDNGTKMYVIGVGGDAVVEYSIDPGNYSEAAANDGSIDNSNPLVILLAADTFQDVDADNILDVGSEVTVNNVPAGLTPVMTLSQGDTVATLTFTGSATYHQDLNDVADITFVFDDTAFTSGDAAVVLRSGDGGAYSSNVGIDFEDNPTLSYNTPGDYTEAAANDGSIDNSNPIVITLDGDTFQDTDANNILDVGSEVTVNNVPAGLTAVMTLSQGDTVATLTFTGSATSHQDLNDVADITFIFDDTAFTGGDAAVVLNSGDGGAYSSNVGIDFADNPTLTYITPNAYDVSTSVYAGAGEEFDVSGQETAPSGLAFNNDGTKMFVIGVTGNAVVEYSLSTAYDVSTAVYAGAGEEFSVNAEESKPSDVAFNNDGTKMFVLGFNDDAVVEYSLSVAYDVSTATYAGAGEEFSVGGQELNPTGFAFNDDGTKMFVIGVTGDAVVEYSLSAAYDVSTATYAGAGEEFYVAGQEGASRGLAFNNDGTKMFVIGYNDDAVIEYSLSVAYDVSTATYAGAGEEFYAGGQESEPLGLAFNNDGTKMFVTGQAGDAVVEYTIDPGNYSEAAANDGSIDNSNPLVIVLADDTFQDTDADNILDVGSEVTVNYVPAGLTAVMTLSQSDTVATLTFTGSATSHLNSNDVADITFVFDDTAFTGGDASVVFNSGDGGAYSSNVGIDFADNPTLTYISPNAYDVSTSVYAGAGEEFSVKTEDGTPQGVTFNNDGTKMFVIGNDDNAVVEYSLSTAYDVSTAVYAGAGEEFSVGGQEVTPTGLAFNNDGTKMFVIGRDDGAVVEYSLSTAYDVSTATYAGAGEEFYVGAQDALPTGLTFNNDGTKMFVMGNNDNAVVEYNLSVAYDVSTAIYAGAGEELAVGAQDIAPHDVVFNDDGTKMFVIGNDDDRVVEYNLSVAYDVSTATYAGAGEELYVGGQESQPFGLAFNNDGTKMFVIGIAGDAVVEYTIDPGNYAGAAANDGSIDNSNPLVIVLAADTFQDVDADNILDVGSEVTVNYVPAGLTAVMTLSASDTVATLTFTGSATSHQDLNDVADITFVFDDTAFTGGDAAVVLRSGDGGAYSSNVGIDFEDNPTLTYISPNAYDVSTSVYAGAGEEFSVGGQDNVPTSLAFNNDGTKMFVLGEADGAVVEYALSTAYDVSTASYAGAGEELYIGGQEATPTGLAFNNDGTKMFVIGITGDAVVEYSLSTAYDVSTATYAGAGEEFSVNAEEADPTGLAFNDDGTKMFVIGNVGNAVVEYNLSVAYDVSTATYAGAGEEFDVGGQETTPRGLVFDNDGTKMFVIGSDDSAVVEYSLSTAYDVSTATYAGAGEEFGVGGQESYPRGLAFNNDGTKMFVMGDAGDAVVEYTIDPGNYSEAAANDGSIDNSNPLVIVLAGDTFQDTDADNILDVGPEVTVNNVPAGLTPVMTLSQSDTVATLVFTGIATSHLNANDVADITFTFDDTAFTGGDAAVVLHSGDGGAYSSNVGVDFSDPVVSGTVYTDEGITTIADGTTVNVLVNGVSVGTDTTVGGAYSVSGVAGSAGDVITVYLDTAGGANGAMVTRFMALNITDADVYQNYLITRTEDGTALSNANLDAGQDGTDTDLTAIYADGGATTLTVASGKELFIWTDGWYAPEGTVTAGGNVDINGALTPAAGITINVAGDWDNDGTFTAGTSTVILSSASNDHTITGTTTFNNLTVTEDNDSDDGTLTFANGTVTTITGVLTLDGFDADDRINLVTDSAGSTAAINMSGASTVVADYLDVKDHIITDNSTGVALEIDPANSINSGNNTGWFNDAPVLDNSGEMTLTAIAEDDFTNGGNIVAEIIASAGGNRITDVDAGAVEGIAVTGLTDTNGTWQYRSGPLPVWTAISTASVADNSALLLASTDSVRFVPTADYCGSATGGITFRAWDQTSGSAGDTTADASANGGTTAFSTASETATVTVTAVNDAPTGSVAISGTATEDQILTAAHTLADGDGLGTISYQWQHDGVDISGATASTHALGDANVGTVITVVASYIDGNGTAESVTSNTTTPVVNVDDPSIITGTFARTVIEDHSVAYTAAGILAISDVDTDHNPVFVDASPVAGDNNYGTFELTGGVRRRTLNNAAVQHLDVGEMAIDTWAGVWRYTLNNAAVQHLDVGETIIDTYTFAATDGHAQQVTVTIVGTFDHSLSSSVPPPRSPLGSQSSSVTPSAAGITRDWTTGSILDLYPALYQYTALGGNSGFTFIPAADCCNPMALPAQGSYKGITFAVPTDMFQHEDVDSGVKGQQIVSYEAALHDGSPIPGWLSFDPQSGSFSGNVPEGAVGSIYTRVTAIHQDGTQTAIMAELRLDVDLNASVLVHKKNCSYSTGNQDDQVERSPRGDPYVTRVSRARRDERRLRMIKRQGKRHTPEQISRKLREADTMLAGEKTIGLSRAG